MPQIVEANRRKRMLLPKPFHLLLEEVGAICEICLSDLRGLKACADHDHRTGLYRGVLCNKCNIGLGLFSDAASLLISAITYLSRWEGLVSVELPKSALTLNERRHASRHGTRFTQTKAQMFLFPYCGVCSGNLANLNSRQVHIDHDHVSGYSRGLLCGRCNRGLGMFKDSPNLLAKAANYLERCKKPHDNFDREAQGRQDYRLTQELL